MIKSLLTGEDRRVFVDFTNPSIITIVIFKARKRNGAKKYYSIVIFLTGVTYASRGVVRRVGGALKGSTLPPPPGIMKTSVFSAVFV